MVLDAVALQAHPGLLKNCNYIKYTILMIAFWDYQNSLKSGTIFNIYWDKSLASFVTQFYVQYSDTGEKWKLFKARLEKSYMTTFSGISAESWGIINPE